MKRKFLILTLTLALGATTVRAETNNLTSLLQQGLLEEQAGGNLDGAIADYRAVAAEFDRNRQLAATAVFRLGECFRAQGKTNEAVAQYQRVVREFSDQAILAGMSRQNLVGLGAGAAEAQPAESNDAKLWDAVKNLPKDKLENVLPTLVNDSELTSLEQQEVAARMKFEQARDDYGPENMNFKDAKHAFELLHEAIDTKIDGMMQALQYRAEMSRGSLAASGAGGTGGENLRTPHALFDEEDAEVQHIQRMIQNSPDLVNNGNLLYFDVQRGWLRVVTFLLDHGVNVNGHDANVPLIAAAAAAEKAMVELLLSRGADINARGGTGGTALHQAVEGGYLAVVEALLAHKPDLNARNSDANNRQTPLHIAAQKGFENMVKLLLGAGADPNVENARGMTPLSYAAQNGSIEIEKMLVAAKADPNGGKLDAPLLAAVHRNDAASAELLLQAGADPNAAGMVDWQVNGWRMQAANGAKVTPVFLAVSTSQLPMTQFLLKHKADPNIPAENGDPLVFSTLMDARVLEALLDAGAKVEAPGQSGYVTGHGNPVHWTPLGAAARHKYADSVDVLLKHGANPNAVNDSGETPLFLAAQGPADVKTFKLLLDAKADPNVREESGRTPLDVLKQRFAPHPGFARPDDQRELAMALVDLLHQYGALDNLPNWDRIEVLPDSTHNAETILLKDTNGWNRFTLVETIFDYFVPGKAQSIPGGVYAPVFVQREGGTAIPRPTENAMPFPDLAHVVILRPRHGSTNTTKIAINLLDANNAIDCSKDVPLEFGDVVEIPQCDHPLGAAPWWVNDNQVSAMINYLHGTAHLVARDQKAELPLDPWGDQSLVGSALHQSAAQQILLASSDLAHVKVTRHDAKTGQEREWIVDCSGSQSPDLVLRDGDVVTVPEKQ